MNPGNQQFTGQHSLAGKSLSALREVQFNVGDCIRIPDYPTVRGFRVWKIIGHHLGALGQEGTWALKSLDHTDNEPIHVPCVMLETNPLIERV